MDLELNTEQTMLVDSLDNIGERYQDFPADERRNYNYYAHALERDLDSAGFYDVARTPGLGALDAALVVERIARLPVVVEVGASIIVAPQLSATPLPRPLALISGDIRKPQRMLNVAKAALAVHGDKVVVVKVDPNDVEQTFTILGYPYGRFTKLPDLDKADVLEGVTPQMYFTWARISLAAESAGALRSAVDFTVDYVKQRRLFGVALGSFQAVQHRLAQCHQIAQGAALVAFQAAEFGDPLRAALAASYAQMHIPKATFDLHQFNGGMGMTNEHKLHFWTFRLRALHGEFAGPHGAALDAANLMWGDAA